MRISVISFPLRCTVFPLNAAVFADLALYLADGGLASVELPCSLTTLVLQARLAPIPRLHILVVWSCSRSLCLSSSSLVGSRSATSYLATALLSARGLHHCIGRLSCGLLEVGLRYVPDLAASHRLGPSVLTVALVESLQFSAQPWSPPETFRHHIDKTFPGCPHFTWDMSLVELDMQIWRLFSQ